MIAAVTSGLVVVVAGITRRIEGEFPLHRDADRLADAEEHIRLDRSRLAGRLQREGDWKSYLMLVARPFRKAVVEAFGSRKPHLHRSDIDAFRDIDLRRHSGVARITPISLPPGLEIDFQGTLKDAGCIDTCGHQPHAAALHLHPVAGGRGRTVMGNCEKQQADRGCEQKTHGRHLSAANGFRNQRTGTLHHIRVSPLSILRPGCRKSSFKIAGKRLTFVRWISCGRRSPQCAAFSTTSF